jgi:predicted 3-demethylubiquinone-9 3-methyltransferase (glyoxalase superfamily)
MEHSKQKIKTLLMFDGKAAEAMNYYVSVFDQAEILSINRYGANEAGAEGTVMHATFSFEPGKTLTFH